jgi:RecA/RadA recombinase
MIDSIYFDAIAKVEKNFKVNSSILNLESMKKWRISSGSVMLDLLLGGGYVPGWVRNWGGEGSSKSTSSQLTAVAQLLREYRPPISMLWDYENSANPEIMESILKSLLGPKTEMNYDKLFGVRDPETGDWIIPPVIHYYNTNIGETFYNVTANILKMLPDKEFVADENHPEGGRWYKIFENTKEGKAYAGDKFDKKLYQKTKRYYVEDETGGTPQLIAIVDSLQAMVPEDNDGDEVSNAKGIEARMHGENLKRVRGRLRAKHSLVIVIGQLREKPMVMFGTPEYTPGGNTLNHADDVRNKFTKRASPNGGDNVDRRTGFENEVSVIKAGAMDSYQYINVKNEKNKFGSTRIAC